jgi:hypothetical protein
MLLEGWQIVAALLVFVGGAIAGFVGAAVAQMGLRRAVRSLEYDVADLETRVVREVKLRAGTAGVKAKKADEELMEQLASQPQKPPGPWWMELVHPDLRR